MDDQIGIFEVKDGKVTQANVRYTNDGNLWNGINAIKYDADATYFAYYPYISDDDFKTLTGATDISSAVGVTAAAATFSDLKTTAQVDSAKAEQFFKSLISKWTPKTDQSKIEDYNASDLMVATGEVPPEEHDQYAMNFIMRHQMGLCLTTLKPINYYVDATYSFNMLPYYQISGDVKPCLYQDKYRYIVVPGKEATLNLKADDVSLPITYYVKTKGHYMDHVVGGVRKEYQVKVGDIFYSNGGMTHQGSFNPYYTPVGLVGYTANSDDPMMNGYSHGLVIGGRLYDVTPSSYEYSVSDTVKNSGKVDGYLIFNYNDILADNNGIQRTKDFSNVAVNYRGNAVKGSMIIAAMNNLLPLHPASTTPNSGWFLPVSGQMASILNGLYVAGGGTNLDFKSHGTEACTASIAASGIKSKIESLFSNLGEGHHMFSSYERDNIKGDSFITFSYRGQNSNNVLSIMEPFTFVITDDALVGAPSDSYKSGLVYTILAF